VCGNGKVYGPAFHNSNKFASDIGWLADYSLLLLLILFLRINARVARSAGGLQIKANNIGRVAQYDLTGGKNEEQREDVSAAALAHTY
jgi:hypothetical protein